MPVDLAAADGPGLLVQRALDDHGRVDVLVNNVGGVRLRLDGFLGTGDEEFEWAMRMNFFSALRATRAAIPHMVDQGGGAIVNVASVNSFFQPDAGTIDYGAAKAALLNLSKSLAQEFGAKGIHVNCVSPGPVATDLWLGEHGVAETVAAASGVDADTARESVVASIGGFATGRFTTPGGGRHARGGTGLRANRQCHGRQLRDRRRPDQDDLSSGCLMSWARSVPRLSYRHDHALPQARLLGPGGLGDLARLLADLLGRRGVRADPRLHRRCVRGRHQLLRHGQRVWPRRRRVGVGRDPRRAARGTRMCWRPRCGARCRTTRPTAACRPRRSRKQIDASLDRLRTDYVDLYQAHRFDPDVPIEETIEAFQQVVAQRQGALPGLQRVDAASRSRRRSTSPAPTCSSPPSPSTRCSGGHPRRSCSRCARPTASRRSSGRRWRRAC